MVGNKSNPDFKYKEKHRINKWQLQMMRERETSDFLDLLERASVPEMEEIVITSAIPELVGGKLIGLVNLLVPAAFTHVAVDHLSSECDQCASRIISIYCSNCECSIDWGAYAPYRGYFLEPHRHVDTQ
ncbi:hypothetical protein ACFX2J_009905 [Malus domestica]